VRREQGTFEALGARLAALRRRLLSEISGGGCEVTTHMMIVGAVFAYFAIGALVAGTLAMVSHGFTGRLGWEVPALFFLWPLAFLFRIPGMVFIVPAIAVAASIAWLAHWVLP
jgi:hypothetical protein